MKHFRFIAFFLFVALGGFQVQAAPLEAEQIVTQMIDNLRARANLSHYEVTIERPRWKRTLSLKAWDHRGEKKVFLLITQPAKEKGKGFLRIDYNLWTYLPEVEKIIKIPASMMLQPWMGSDFSNDDLVKESSYTEDYTHEIIGTETIEGVPVTRIKLLPKPHAPVVWGSVVFWVRSKPYLPMRQHFYNEKGELVKELTFSVFKKMDNRLLPTVWIMNPVRKPQERTILKLKEIDFVSGGQINPSIFTKQNLKNPKQ